MYLATSTFPQVPLWFLSLVLLGCGFPRWYQYTSNCTVTDLIDPKWCQALHLMKYIMRSTSWAALAAICFLHPCFLTGESMLVPPKVTVGRNLEEPVKVKLDDAAPDEGLEITVRSSDPNLLRISASADKLGTGLAVIKARPGNFESQEFWLQGLASSGTVTYTAEAPGRGRGTGTVTLTPSGILIMGPYRIPKFPTTTGALPAKIKVASARLDPSTLKEVAEQVVTGGLKVELSNSNPAIGHLEESPVEIPAGEASVTTLFHPGAEGDVTFTVKVPPGFSVPAEFATITASVKKPGIVVVDDQYIGENLQIAAALALGEYAPVGGLTITLTSSDPSKLLLSNSGTEVGSKSIQIKIPAQGFNAIYYLQALGKSGEVEYTASAPGFRSRTGIIKLTPSGITLTPYFQGPPDEGQVLKQQTTDGNHGFLMKASDKTPMKLIAWTAQLDPKTHRSADITVQPLRGGMSVKVPLTNSNPAVGKVPAEITIAGGSDHGVVDFTPASAGTVELSIVTPNNFTVSANSTKVIGTVTK